jgi:hypothetical protein
MGCQLDIPEAFVSVDDSFPDAAEVEVVDLPRRIVAPLAAPNEAEVADSVHLKDDVAAHETPYRERRAAGRCPLRAILAACDPAAPGCEPATWGWLREIACWRAPPSRHLDGSTTVRA